MHSSHEWADKDFAFDRIITFFYTVIISSAESIDNQLFSSLILSFKPIFGKQAFPLRNKLPHRKTVRVIDEKTYGLSFLNLSRAPPGYGECSSMTSSVLFTPVRINRMTLKNRIIMPAMASYHAAVNGEATEKLIRYHEERAKGGVGLIITEVVTVEPTYTYLPGDMCCYDDTFIPGWEKLAAAVHEYGCKIMPQLFHPAYMAFNIPGTPRLIAPSFVGPSYAREAPRPITVDEIHELTHQFGDAAVRMQKAGVDGVEVHAAHAHGMLGGFLTPLYNKRTDEYGGSFENRFRFPVEIVQAIKAACGDDFPVSLRYSVVSKTKDWGKGAMPYEKDFKEFGRDMEESEKAIKYLADAGYDMFNEMMASIREDTVKMMFRVKVEKPEEREQVAKVTGTNKDDSGVKAPVRRNAPKIQPNDPCPCGSGKKYKQCCGRFAE